MFSIAGMYSATETERDSNCFVTYDPHANVVKQGLNRKIILVLHCHRTYLFIPNPTPLEWLYCVLHNGYRKKGSMCHLSLSFVFQLCQKIGSTKLFSLSFHSICLVRSFSLKMLLRFRVTHRKFPLSF